jgi:hypothetical protein
VHVLDLKSVPPLSGWKKSLGFKSTPQWKALGHVPTPREYACIVVINNCVYIMGGRTKDNSSTSLVEEYRPLTNKWSEAKWTLPEPMIQFGANYDDVNKSLMIFNGKACFIRSFHTSSTEWIPVRMDSSYESSLDSFA